MIFWEKIKHIVIVSIIFIFIGGAVFFFGFGGDKEVAYFFSSRTGGQGISSTTSTKMSTSSGEFQDGALVQNSNPSIKRIPRRNWNVLDPSVTAQALLVQSLDENFPFFSYRIREPWPAASLSKLLTAVVVLEEYGDKKKIPISNRAVTVEGVAGGLTSGEIYLSQDLLKIMLLVSSNRAATAFEDFAGGREEFNWMLNKKAREIGMKNTIMNDASGLSDLNVTTAEDMFLLTKYIYEKHPEIFNWSRLHTFLVQPINTSQSRVIQNINPLVDEVNFLGGKTGTSLSASQNLVSIFSFKEFRIAIIILGSVDRAQEKKNIFSWIENAYAF